jgi:hypothetical protein
MTRSRIERGKRNDTYLNHVSRLLQSIESPERTDKKHMLSANTVEVSILLNIMFHAPMGRFQLELIYYFTYFSTIVPSIICVLVKNQQLQ